MLGGMNRPNLPHFFRLALLAVVVCALGPVGCGTTKRTVEVQEEAADGVTVAVHYQKRQAVRNYPVALMEATRMLSAAATAEAGKRGREIGAVRLTGGSMDYSLVKTRVHVELTARVMWGTGWTGAVDDPTKLVEEAKMKQQNLKDFMGSLGAVKQPPPMQTVNVYVQPQPQPTPAPTLQAAPAPVVTQPQAQPGAQPGQTNSPNPGEQRNVVVP
jgi:hypothetical protein